MHRILLTYTYCTVSCELLPRLNTLRSVPYLLMLRNEQWAM